MDTFDLAEKRANALLEARFPRMIGEHPCDYESRLTRVWNVYLAKASVRLYGPHASSMLRLYSFCGPVALAIVEAVESQLLPN